MHWTRERGESTRPGATGAIRRREGQPALALFFKAYEKLNIGPLYEKIHVYNIRFLNIYMELRLPGHGEDLWLTA
jgi:hypothetical protein